MAGDRKYGRKKGRPSQKRYVAEGRRNTSKRRKARRNANKFGCDIKIKTRSKRGESGEWEIIKPDVYKKKIEELPEYV